MLGRRYGLGELLGAGGFGEVHLGTDTRTGDRVALKRLTRIDPRSLLWFKREFRVLAGCAHPNLVKYHELIHDDEQWWLVMDYVAGADLRTWVRTEAGEEESTRTHAMASMASSAGDAAATLAEAPPLEAGAIARVRQLLPQLQAALDYLHGRGVVHRDLKPANMRIDRHGRLVLLDFGLAVMRGTEPPSADIVGTMRYMAPEQAMGDALPASDWYSVGVILHTLLTGAPPFSGEPLAQLEAKRRGPSREALERRGGVPDDLRELTLSLLAPDPDARACAVAPAQAAAEPRSAASSFVGRADDLAALARLLARARDTSQGSLVLLHGPSGMGKSALTEAFAREVRIQPSALVLVARCHQREALPFKALDGIVDGIAEHLAQMPPTVVARLMPRYGRQLAHVFPVLGDLGGSQRAGAAALEPALEPQEARRRALLALRELLVRLGESRPVLLIIDDLQWSDEDSLVALGAILGAPDPPPLLMVAACRSGDDEPSGRVAALRAALSDAHVPLHDLPLGPLSAEEARELAAAAAAELAHTPSTVTLARAQASAQGQPLLLLELVRASFEEGAPTSVAALVAQRLSRLDPAARRVAQCLAVAGRPRPLAQLMRASALEGGLLEALAWLQAERIVRVEARPSDDEVAPFHDQVADALLASVTPEETRAWHARWAQTLEDLGKEAAEAEAEALHRHHLACGSTGPALRWALVAAARAVETLAFERAAGLYRTASGLAPQDGELELKLADALAAGGNGAQAGEAYQRAATRLDPERARHALRRAAGQFLRSGHMDAGLEMARAALASVGERWPSGPVAALIDIQLGRLLRPRLRLHLLATPSMDAKRVERMDALWEIAHGLGGVDTIRAAALHGRHLALALRSGDGGRIATGLGWEAILSFALGGRSPLARGWRLVERSAGVAMRAQGSRVRAWAQAAAGYGHWCEGRLDQAIAASQEAVEAYREEGRDVAWELGSVIAWCWAPALAARGRIGALDRLCTEAEAEFSRLGDLYTLTTLRTVAKPLVHLARGEPARARMEADAAIERWSRQHWHLQHLFAAFARARADLYEGRAAQALEELGRLRPRMRASFQHKLQIKRVFALHLEACCRAQLGTQASALVKLASAMGAERLGWADGHAAAARAAAAAITGDMPEGGALYRVAAGHYAASGMDLHAWAARWRAADCERATSAGLACARELNALGVSEPERLRDLLVPGSRAR